MMLQPHGARSVTGSLFSSHGRMMAVFRPQLVRNQYHQVLPPSSLGTDPPLEGTAGLAHSLAGKVVTRIMLETQYIFFLLFLHLQDGARFRLYQLSEFIRMKRNKRRTERTNGRARNTSTIKLRRNESRRESMCKEKKKKRVHTLWTVLFERVSLN